MNTREITSTLTTLLGELLDGPPGREAYMLNGGDAGLLRSLDGRSALCVSTFAGLYRATLDRIEASGFDVFNGPPHLSALTKLRIVGEGLRR